MAYQLSLAPFQGITNKNFRNIFTRYFPGYDTVYTPFISGVGNTKVNPSKFSDLLPIADNTVTTIPQFVSTDALEVIEIAKHLKDYGYNHINWNFGCPFSRIANKMRGCGILPFPDIIKKLLDEIMPSLPLELSIKTRLGYKSPDELFEVFSVFNQYPFKEIVIHPRIGTQLYRGEVNLKSFAEILPISRHKVIYNGDIYHNQKLQELEREFPSINSWMVGRGALINPFLAAQIKDIYVSDFEKRERLNDFHSEIFNAYLQQVSRKTVFLGTVKAIWYYMSGMFQNGEQFFDKIKVCKDIDDYKKISQEMLDQPFANNEQIETYFKTSLKHI